MRALLLLFLLAGSNSLAADLVLSGGSWSLDNFRFTNNRSSSLSYEASLLLDERHWDISVGSMSRNSFYEVGSIQYVSAQRIMRLGEILPLDLFLGLGGLWRSNGDRVDEILPSEINFSISAGLDVGIFRVQLRHASNGGLKDPNVGVNWILFGIVF